MVNNIDVEKNETQRVVNTTFWIQLGLWLGHGLILQGPIAPYTTESHKIKVISTIVTVSISILECKSHSGNTSMDTWIH